MRRAVIIVATAAILGGCALPLPVQVAGWVMDGVSLATTDKTLADHGLSMAAGKDCALWRGISEGNLCRDGRGNILMVGDPRQPAVLTKAPVEVAAMPAETGQPAIAGPYLEVR